MDDVNWKLVKSRLNRSLSFTHVFGKGQGAPGTALSPCQTIHTDSFVTSLHIRVYLRAP